MRSFPAFFDLKGRKIVILGSGEAALAKARLFFKTGADLVMIRERAAPENADTLSQEWASLCLKAGFLDFHQFETALENAIFVILACEALEPAEIINLATRARAAGALVNCVDRPEYCDFSVPAIIDRDDIVVGISSSGSAPILAGNIRRQIEKLLPKTLGHLARFSRQFKDRVKQAISHAGDRRQFWQDILSGPIGKLVLDGQEIAAEDAFDRAIKAYQKSKTLSSKKGKVDMVGAGPGNPELLSLKAHRLLQNADIVFYDRLVGTGILDMIRPDARRISVGKTKGDHTVAQSQIHELMVKAANAGMQVVRLKGGDPLIFGRGGEEISALKAAGIPTDITPGISAALGCAASIKTSLTHRNKSKAVTFITGHDAVGKLPDLDWSALIGLDHTLIVFMGLSHAVSLRDNLIKAGRKGATPVAIIENGTRDNERRFYGLLHTLDQLIIENEIKSPALIIIGEVIDIPELSRTRPHDQLATFSAGALPETSNAPNEKV